MTGQPHRAELSAGWAIWGKRPGSSGDYGVIEFSKEPGLHDYQYDEIVRYFSVGTPPTGRDLAGSLPWVTISTMIVNGLRYVGIAIKEPTADVDAAGRPITRTRFFCVPYRPFAEGPVGYFTLYRALAAVHLPAPDRDQVRLSVPALDPEALAEEIVTELGEAAVTLAAALLLRGAVTVVRADDATLDQRLRFIDAVTALLPYGFRAANTAATWSDSVAPDTIRLAFAAWPRESTGVVGWHAAQPPPVDDDVAAHYHKELRRLRDDQPGTGRLASIIEFLVRDTTPRSSTGRIPPSRACGTSTCRAPCLPTSGRVSSAQLRSGGSWPAGGSPSFRREVARTCSLRWSRRVVPRTWPWPPTGGRRR